jgi:hypothetical protein
VKIWKWQLDLTDTQGLSMPVGAEILSVQVQDRDIQLWALVDETQPNEWRFFAIHGTGQAMPEKPGKFLGTVQLNSNLVVLHVFEVVRP